MCRYSALALLLFAPAPMAMEQTLHGLIETRVDVADGVQSWTERGPGKLRNGTEDDETDTALALRAALDWRVQLAETVGTHLTLDSHAGDDGNAGITAGWLAWTPVPASAWQFRARAGGFIPPFSLEHAHTGWTSPYMPTASVLNSWIGEELHVTGAEFTARRLGAQSGSPHTLALHGAVFRGNDTAGTLLSWRGWAANDRVTPRHDRLPLPDRAAFRPGGTFPGLHDTDPFVELDGRLGWYLHGEWQYDARLKIVAAHYDNNADPTVFADGQAGWRTRFALLGAHWKPARDTDLLLQYATGNTFVGRSGSIFNADNDFTAWYALLSRQWNRQRLAARAEGFRVTDEDINRLDDNRETGTAWALSWQYDWERDFVLGVELLAVRSERPERALIGLPATFTERQLRGMLRWNF